ncbi:tol-pal system YbgF family protein [Acidobacteriota bacterium]
MKIKRSHLLISILMITSVVISTAVCAQDVKEEDIEALIKKPTLTLKEQELLAKALFEKMYNADESELEVFEVNYKIVIEKCPDTVQAHHAVHRLTNMYTLAYDEPRYEDIITVLEPFLKRTKTSEVLSMVKYPDEHLVFSPIAKLHQSYEQLGKFDKIAEYYDGIAKKDPDLGAYDCFDYANALDESKRIKDAINWYEIFLKKSEGTDMDFMREIVQDRLKEIK